MKRWIYLIVSVLLVFCMNMTSTAQTKSDKIKPRWLRSIPKSSNSSYLFVRTESSGKHLNDARGASLADLAADLGLEKGVNAVTNYKSLEYEHSETSGDVNSYASLEDFQVTSEINGKPVSFNAKVIDEYWEKSPSGNVVLKRLYAHSVIDKKVQFDSFRLTEKYHNDPATWGLSLIPGAAQMHKGSYLKGGLIMGGAVALAAGALVAENLRNVNKGKIAQTHSADVKKQYNDRVNTCATVRNICLGGLAAVYIYNIIDAFVAPGARRVIVTPSSDGVGVAYKF